MSFPYGFVATVERPTGFDDDGVPLAQADPHTIQRCVRDQTQTIELSGGEQVVVTRERILCDNPNADVQTSDVLVLPDGTRWQVNGDVDRPRSPWDDWQPGCVIPVIRAAGTTPPQPVEE